MKKSEAIKIISDCAKLYDKNLCDKNLLIIHGVANSPQYIEIVAQSQNFAHLTGVELSNISPESFYSKAYNHKLTPNDFEFKKDGTTELKLTILHGAMKIAKTAKMIGDFRGNRPKLQTNKLAGTTNFSVGFVLDNKSNQFFVPNTILKGNIKDDIFQHQRVLAILSKRINEPCYNTIESVAKGIDIILLLEKLQKAVHIDTSLYQNESSPNIQNIQFTTPDILPSPSGAATIPSPMDNLVKGLSDAVEKLHNFFASFMPKPKRSPRSRKSVKEEQPRSPEQSEPESKPPRQDAPKAFAVRRSQIKEIAGKQAETPHVQRSRDKKQNIEQ